jgi:membrane protein
VWSRLTRWCKRTWPTGLAILDSARRSFLRHRVSRLGAGLAFYSLSALVPTLLLALAIAAALFGREAAEGQFADRLDNTFGTALAEQIEQAVAELWENTNTSSFALVAVAVIIYSASSLFLAWRDTLEVIWELPFRSGLKTSIMRRLQGALVPIAVGIFLSVMVFVEVLAAMVGGFVTAPWLDAIVHAFGRISPTVVSVFALAVAYRVSTRVRPWWRDIWPGTLVASLALAVLVWGYGLYVRVFGASSAAGAAGAVILGLTFVYYAAQILLYGAEIVAATAAHRNRRVATADDSAAGHEVVDRPTGEESSRAR